MSQLLGRFTGPSRVFRLLNKNFVELALLVHASVRRDYLTDHNPYADKKHAKDRVYPLEGHSLPFVIRVNKSASSLRKKVTSIS
ncbi:MAG: hypothetical protein Aurels2KO_13860 [Aureliella sp.]